MTLSIFPTFLAFLIQALCFSAAASNPWETPGGDLDIPPTSIAVPLSASRATASTTLPHSAPDA
jgi:hypothetical protein